MSCQSPMTRIASGGVLWNPRTQVHPSVCVRQRNWDRFCGFEYDASHIAPPQPPSQLSAVWLLMYPTLVLMSTFWLGVICRLVRPENTRRMLFDSAPSSLLMSPLAKYRSTPAPPLTLPLYPSMIPLRKMGVPRSSSCFTTLTLTT